MGDEEDEEEEDFEEDELYEEGDEGENVAEAFHRAVGQRVPPHGASPHLSPHKAPRVFPRATKGLVVDPGRCNSGCYDQGNQVNHGRRVWSSSGARALAAQGLTLQGTVDDTPRIWQGKRIDHRIYVKPQSSNSLRAIERHRWMEYVRGIKSA